MSYNHARDAFDQWAETYDQDVHTQTHWISPMKVAEALQRHSKKMSVSKIVDLGTGTGLLIPHLQSQFAGASITGVDQSSKMLDEYRKKGLGGEIIHFDLNEETWPLGEQSVQVATSSGVLEFIRDSEIFIRNIGRLLQHDGLTVITFEKHELRGKTMASALRVYPRSPNEIAAQFANAGFQIAEQSEFVAYKLMGEPVTYALIAARKHDCVWH